VTFMVSDAPAGMTFMIELAIVVLAAVPLADRAKPDSNRRDQATFKAPACFRIHSHHLPTANLSSWMDGSIPSVFDSCMSSLGLDQPFPHLESHA
jgi:hypothetical protein